MQTLYLSQKLTQNGLMLKHKTIQCLEITRENEQPGVMVKTLFVVVVVSSDRVSHSNLSWFETQLGSPVLASNCGNPPASISQELRLQVWATTFSR